MIGQNINAYFDTAMMYPLERLHAVLRNEDKSIPAAAAMMALPLKEREMAAAAGMQAAQQPQQPSIRQQMAQAITPQAAVLNRITQQPVSSNPAVPQGNQQQVAALPENTGVMGIPAPNMQKLAGGGIIAFDDGGEVPRYDGSQGSVVGGGNFEMHPELNPLRTTRMAEAEEARAAAEQQDIFKMQERAAARNFKQQAEAEEKARLEALSAARMAARREGRPLPTASSSAATSTALPNYEITPQAGSQSFTMPTPFVDARQKPKEEKAPPVAEKKKEPGIGGIRKPSTGTGTGTGTGSYEDTLKKVGAGDKELLGEYAKAGKEETTGMEALLAEREKNKPGGKAGESLEKYLKGKEAADVTKRAENVNNAFVNAGFAIATGDSPSILQNLAKGGKEGMASYKAGIDKLDAAADERAKLFAGIEDARRAEAKGDWKELYAARAEIKKSESAYKKYGIDALVKLTGENRKVAADMVNTALTNDTRLQATHIAGQYDVQGKREMASATREGTAAYRQGQLRQDALALSQKMLDEKMKQFKLDGLTMSPEVYEQWRAHYSKLAFNQMGIPQPGTTSAGGNVFSDPKEQAAYSKFAGG